MFLCLTSGLTIPVCVVNVNKLTETVTNYNLFKKNNIMCRTYIIIIIIILIIISIVPILILILIIIIITIYVCTCMLSCFNCMLSTVRGLFQGVTTEYILSIGYIVYCYLEFKLRYLKNLKLFSIRVKELFEPIVLWKKAMGFALFKSPCLRNRSNRVTLGDFTVKNTKLGREICIWNWKSIK